MEFVPIHDDTLDKHFTSIFRSGYVQVNGTTLTDNYKSIYKDIDDFEVYDDDIWMCSFPKTGTTWTQEMVWMILNDLNFDEGQKCITERFPFLDYPIIFDYAKVYESNSEFDPPERFANAIKFVSKQKRPRLIKTHLPWDLLPKDIREGRKHPKIVYVTRNPRDACVSYFHHCKLIEGYRGDFSEFCRLFLSAKLCYTPYWGNVLQYWDRRQQPNVLFLKYEDLKSDLVLVIRNVAEFLAKKMTEDQVEALSRHLSFENMKKNKGVNYEDFVQMHRNYKLVSLVNGNFMRSGTVGTRKLEFDQGVKKEFDVWVQKWDPNNELQY